MGSIQDLDPVNEYYGSLGTDARGRTAGYGEPARTGYRGANGRTQNYQDPYGDQYYQQQQQQQQQQNHYQHYPQQQQYNQYPQQQQQQQPTQQQQKHAPRSTGRVYRALYEYKAQDVDEVSFADGDIIINCTPIDEGWLKGQVQRTGQRGMLPANYVTPAI